MLITDNPLIEQNEAWIDDPVTRGMNALLVEDDRQIGLLLLRVLGTAGFKVTWITNGAQALQVALTERFDLVLLDILLPGKSGWDVLKELRAQKDPTPVLVLSAMDEVGDKVRGLQLGADDYMSKPFDVSELLARIEALIRRSQSRIAVL
jgi:two-component system copper resistance phosphate regulon response regulator CusR